MGSNAASPHGSGPNPKLPWFSTKGQIIDLVLKIVLALLAGKNAWPEMKQNEYLSGGAVLFYALVALVLVSLGIVLNAIRKARHNPTQMPADHLAAAILGHLWAAWAAMGDMYERLAYDNLSNQIPVSPRFMAGLRRAVDLR